MRNLSRNSLSIPALFLLVTGAVLFASGAFDAPSALAQDHGQSPEQTDDHGHSHGADAHGADAHGADTHGADIHGADAHAADAHGDDHGAHGSGIPHLSSLIAILAEAPWMPPAIGGFLHDYLDPIYSLTVVLFLSILFISISRNLSTRNPGRLQMAAEIIIGGLYSLFRSIIGPTAKRYTPYLGTLFLFILCNNLFGILPAGHASTSSFAATTFGLGVMTFLYVQGIAIKENGIGGYLHHLAGSPKTGLDWGMSVLLFPLHTLGELIKPISLSLRLFGNIFGEDTLVATMVILGGGMVISMTGIEYLPGLPLQFPFYLLGMLSSTIQAVVFTLLSTVYIALWLPHGEEHGH